MPARPYPRKGHAVGDADIEPLQIVASTRLFFANSSASFTPSRGADLTAVRLPSDRTCADAHIPAYACPAQKSGGERMAPCDLAPSAPPLLLYF